MKKTNRVKTPAAEIKIPQSRAAVVESIAEIGRAQRERARIQAAMNDEIAGIKQLHESDALPLAEKIRALSAGVQGYCEAHRDELTQGGKVKHAMLASGKISWRMRPPSVSVRGVDAVIELLKRLGLSRFVRQKEEVNKEALLAEPELAKTVQGVSINQAEEFVITPFETELEEVA